MVVVLDVSVLLSALVTPVSHSTAVLAHLGGADGLVVGVLSALVIVVGFVLFGPGRNGPDE